MEVLEQQYRVIRERKDHPKKGSYTNYLFEKGLDKILKKIGEESTEIVIASKNSDKENVKYEIADYLYYLMVLMADPLGNIPITIACMKNVPNHRRVRVIFRECVIAMVTLLLAMFFGHAFMTALGLSDAALTIGGSVIVMLMAIRMVFPSKEGVFGETPDGEPFIVPLAIPAIAGPSTIATIMMIAATDPSRTLEWGAIVVITAFVSFVVLASADWLQQKLGEKVTMAVERLTGLLLAMMATQMFLSGTAKYVEGLIG